MSPRDTRWRRPTFETTDFLTERRRTNLVFLKRTNPGVHDVQDLRDVRIVLISELQQQYPPK